MNTLSNAEYAYRVLTITSELQAKNFDPELDIFDITIGTELDFEEWLEAEYNEGG